MSDLTDKITSRIRIPGRHNSNCSLINHGLKTMKTTTFLLASILARPSLQAGLRSQAGDEGSQNECVTCSYLELFDICVPKEKSPSGSKWACDFQGKDEKVDSDLWGCLMTGVDSASCTGATNGTCIWCAEPVLGLCVTPEVAAKLNFLPFFTCDSHITPVSLL